MTTHEDASAQPTYVRASCYPVPDGYRVELHPTGGALPGPHWPRPCTHPTLATAMAWAYATTAHHPDLHLDGLTLAGPPPTPPA